MIASTWRAAGGRPRPDAQKGREMLTAAENERLTRGGPGTPCGELMQRYWHPAATVQLEDAPVRKVRILGEDLVLFRDRSGHLGPTGCCSSKRKPALELGVVCRPGRIRGPLPSGLLGEDLHPPSLRERVRMRVTSQRSILRR
jgi:hypothetical protein